MLILFTDTDTDMTPATAKKYGYHLISMPYSLNDIEISPYEDWDEFDYKTYYNQLRAGSIPTTCAISPLKYIEYFEPYFKNGDDILYVHFSKAMSGTFNALNLAIEELQEKYPERKLYTIDTKGITICSYNILLEIGKLYQEGKSIKEIIEWSNQEVNKFAIYFYADDLKFFSRSGRVSNFSAAMGNILGIHPIIHINQEGIMTNLTKAKGRINSLKKIVEYVINLEENIKDYHVIIGHTDNIELAHKLAEMLNAKFGEDLSIEYIVVNPTAGAHCGPDGVGVCFHAKHR